MLKNNGRTVHNVRIPGTDKGDAEDGPLSKIAEMIPGMSAMKLPEDMMNVQEEKMKKWKHMIDSMNADEKNDPETIKQNRIVRIAKGSGTSEADVRELLKYYKQIKKIMKLTKGGKGFKRVRLQRLQSRWD